MSTQKLSKEFEKIYNETYKNTIKYVICKCSNINDIDDIIQETYLELYKVLKTKKKILDYKSYTVIIAKNKIIEYFNSGKKLKTIPMFQEEDEDECMLNLDARDRYRNGIYYKR